MFPPWLLHRILLCSALLTTFLVFWLLSARQGALLLRPQTVDVTTRKDRSYFPATPELCRNESTATQFCSSFPYDALASIQVTVKTGIGERNKLEALLSTYGSCINNLLIVSDTVEVVHGQRVHDVLGDLPSSYEQDNSDWSTYEAQRQSIAAGNEVGTSHEGWKLDRFKFLPMVEYAYANNSNAEWYIFIEADTYVFWDVLFRTLKKMDPYERHYIGTAVPGAHDRWFAYGGAAIVLSQGLLRDLALKGDQRLSVKYEWMAREDCCGDAVLAYVFHAELGVRLKNMYPTFSGEEPQWKWISEDNWCTPLLSLHHINSETMSSLWHWERCGLSAARERPITFSTLLAWGLPASVADGFTTKSQWDNGADIQQAENSSTHASSETCFQTCKSHPHCIQASYAKEVCRFAERLRIGHAVGEEFESFWDTIKMERLGWQPGAAALSSCNETKWLSPKLMLPPKDVLQKLGLKPWP
jgi:hypothetical protein